MKGLNYDFFRFNNTGEGHSSYMRPGNFHGLSFGFYQDMNEYLSCGIGLVFRRFSTEGSRTVAPPGRPNDWSIRVNNNAMMVNLGVNIKQFTFGYEVEVGRAKIFERKDSDDWDKMTKSPILVGSLGLYLLYRPEIKDPFFGFIKGFWRPGFGASEFYGNDYMERDRFLHLGQFGVVLGLYHFEEQ
jgi:hypothetical protein